MEVILKAQSFEWNNFHYISDCGCNDCCCDDSECGSDTRTCEFCGCDD